MDHPFTLADVVTNAELARRPLRAPEYQAESEALNVLAQTMAHSPEDVLQKLVEVAQQLCHADTAGISLLETHNGDQVFRWEALAGVLKDHVNGSMPRNASPCGTTVDRDATQLMYLPERFFPALKIEPPIVEALLVPFHMEGKPIGTVWVVTHTDNRKFDREDEHIIKTLANFAAAGWQLWRRRRTAEAVTTSTKHDLFNSIEREQKLEQQLQHAHRMESMGTLAGGIAHDFNNLLNVIQSYTTLMENDPTSLAQYLEVIKETVKEGTALTHQLLTVARKTKVQFDSASVNRLITTTAKWLESTFPKTITINVELDPSVPHIQADASQLNQALLNLCLNARDAMGEGGNLRMTTTILAGKELRNHFSESENVNYVCITISDTGPGIDENVRQHIFEPFYTTKEEGKGTGLGLSIVYGIVKSHHGFIDVDSHSGHGCRFQIYLPVAH